MELIFISHLCLSPLQPHKLVMSNRTRGGQHSHACKHNIEDSYDTQVQKLDWCAIWLSVKQTSSMTGKYTSIPTTIHTPQHNNSNHPTQQQATRPTPGPRTNTKTPSPHANTETPPQTPTPQGNGRIQQKPDQKTDTGRKRRTPPS